MSESNFNKLERVQYALKRVVTGMLAYTCDHITSVLAKLSIRVRISFKIAMMVFKILQIKQLSYLTELIEDTVPFRTVLSSICRQGTLRE